MVNSCQFCEQLDQYGASDFFAICKEFGSKKVAVLGHVHPDADCIGAQVAVCEILRHLNVDAYIKFEDKNIASNLKWMINDEFLTIDNDDFDEIVIVDCGNIGRAGKFAKEFRLKPKLMVDHHMASSLFAENNFCYPEVSSTCEILAAMIFVYQFPLSKSCANALFAGIFTDTGKFSYSATTSQTFRIASQLVMSGADPNCVFNNIFQNESREKIALFQRFLQTLRFYCDGKVCVGVVTEKDYKLTKTSSADTDGFVNFPRSISGVEVSILVYDRDGLTRLSLRCDNPSWRLDLFAAKFNGGGHSCAAAFTISDSYEKFEKFLINALQEHINSFSK